MYALRKTSKLFHGEYINVINYNTMKQGIIKTITQLFFSAAIIMTMYYDIYLLVQWQIFIFGLV